MAFLVTVVTGGSAHVPIFPTRYLVAATIISSRSLGRVDSNGRSGALRPGAARATIVTIFIVPILLVVPPRSLQGLSSLGTIRRHSSCFLGAERKRASVPGVILSRFQSGAVAPETASVHLTDPRRKVEGGLSLSRDSLTNGLVPSILLTIFSLDLGTDGGP